MQINDFAGGWVQPFSTCYKAGTYVARTVQKLHSEPF